MNVNKFFWTEKYRPENIKSIIGQELSALKLIVEARHHTKHFIFSGKPGTGKTTAALALAKELFGNNYKTNFREFYGKEVGVSTVKGTMIDYATTHAFGNAQFRIIFVDEANAMSKDAKEALKRPLEIYARNCLWIFSTNHLDEMGDALKSRCKIIKFKPISKEDTKKVIERIIKCEEIEIEPDALNFFIQKCSGDLRDSIKEFQGICEKHRNMPGEIKIDEIKGFIKNEDVIIDNIIRLCFKTQNWTEIQEEIHKKLSNVEPRAILQKIQNRLKYKIEKYSQDLFFDSVIMCGELDYAMSVGTNNSIQLDKLIAYFCLIGYKQKYLKLKCKNCGNKTFTIEQDGLFCDNCNTKHNGVKIKNKYVPLNINISKV